MAGNTLMDLSDSLFDQLKRLSDDGLSEERLEMEISRSKAVCCVASQIIANSNTMIRAAEAKDAIGTHSAAVARGLMDGRPGR